MALLNIDTVTKRVISLINKAKNEHGVEILTYKRNRGVEIIRDTDMVAIREWGYHEESWLIPTSDLAKLLKTILKREFPRSRKVRLYQLNGPEDRGVQRQKI